MSSTHRGIAALKQEFEQKVKSQVKPVDLSFGASFPHIDLSAGDRSEQIEAVRKKLLRNIADRTEYIEQRSRKSLAFCNQLENVLCTQHHSAVKLEERTKENEVLKRENDTFQQVNAQLQRELAALKLRIARNEVAERNEERLIEREQERSARLEQECRQKSRQLTQLRDHLGSN